MTVEEFNMQHRSAQVLADAHRRQPTDLFVIDDDGFGWPTEAQNKLVLTKGGSGLKHVAVQEEMPGGLQLTQWADGPLSISPTSAPF